MALSSMPERMALSYLAAGDHLHGVITGKWTTKLLEPDRNLAIVAGVIAAGPVAGLAFGSMVSRDGEAGWLLLTDWAVLVVGASKVSGAPGKLIVALPRETPMALGGKRGNYLAVAGMTLVVKKHDLSLAASLEHPQTQANPWPSTPDRDGEWPYAWAAPALPPPSALPPPAPPQDAPAATGSAPVKQRRWTPPPGAQPIPDEPPVGGLFDLFKTRPSERPEEDPPPSQP